MNIWQKISGVDRRILYVMFAIVILYPQFVPTALPMAIDPTTRGLYDAIEKLQPGDPILISTEFSAVMYSELSPVLHVVSKHAFSKGLRVFYMSTDPDGAQFNIEVIDKLVPANYVYGKNVVNLGYTAGYEAAVAALCKDFPGTWPADYKQQPTRNMEIMNGIKDITSFKMVFQMTGGALGPLLWVRQANIPFKTICATAVSSSMVPSAVPYYQAGQLVALLNGLKGCAEYELLTKLYGKGVAGMAGQSLGHLYIVVIVLVANVAYFMNKQQDSKKK
jgi:hypothetical protein